MRKNIISTIKNLNQASIIVGSLVVTLSLFALIGCMSDNKDKKLGATGVSTRETFNLQGLKNKQNLVSVAVIGSGPAGMMAGVYGTRALRDTVIFEGDKPGGLLMDTTDVENWPGELAINGPDIMGKLRVQARKLGSFFIQEAVESVDFSQWPYRLTTDNGTQLHALSVIIATGATPKRLGIPGEDENWGSGVSACAVCDAAFFREKDVIVAGGGDSAIEEAIQLSPYVKTVTIMVRKESMRAAASMQQRLKNYANIRVQYNVELKEVLNNDRGYVTHVVVYNNALKKTETVAIDGVFLAIGHAPNTEIFKGQLAMDDQGHILVADRTQKTSVAGVFAAGDVEDTLYRQAGVAAASGIKAALDADQFLGTIGVTKELMDSLKDRLMTNCLPSMKNRSVPLTTLDELEAYSASENAMTVVLFHADTCKNSAQMMPIFQELAQEDNENFFATVDSDQAEELVKKFFVHKVPCILVFKKGEFIGRCNGLVTKQKVREFVDSFQE